MEGICTEVPAKTKFYKRALIENTKDEVIVELEAVEGSMVKKNYFKQVNKSNVIMVEKLKSVISSKDTNYKSVSSTGEIPLEITQYLSSFRHVNRNLLDVYESVGRYNRTLDSINKQSDNKLLTTIKNIIDNGTTELKKSHKLTDEYYIINKAKVTKMYCVKDPSKKPETKVVSFRDPGTEYKEGVVVEADMFLNRMDDLRGLHVFMNEKTAFHDPPINDN